MSLACLPTAAAVALLIVLPCLGGQLTIDPAAPFHPMLEGRPQLLLGCSDRSTFFIWENDKGFHWRRYLETLHDAGFSYVRHDVCAWHGIAAASGWPAQFTNPMWPFGRVIGDDDWRFDLRRYNDEYFEERLRTFLGEAERLGVVCELTLFDAARGRRGFDESLYAPEHNANSLELSSAPEPHSDAALENEELLAIQEAYVSRVLDATADLGNVIYEIANETGGALWVEHFVDYIHDRLPGALVSAGEQTSSYDPVGGRCDIVAKHRGTGGLYADHEDLARHRRSLIAFREGGKPVLHNEFFLFANRSTDDPGFVRKTLWADFTGGGHANFFDFTWWRGRGRTMADGPASQPPPDEVLDAARSLRRFIDDTSFPFWRMAPADACAEPMSGHAFAYGEPSVYAIYILPGADPRVRLMLPEGSYEVRWYDPVAIAWHEGRSQAQAEAVITVPEGMEEAAVYLRKLVNDSPGLPAEGTD